MDSVDYIAALRRENDAFHEVVDPSRLGARVEPCPEWSLADLVWHMGEVHWFWGSIAEGRLTDPSQAEATTPERPADGDELVRWARASGDRTHRILAEADPTAPVWTWAPQKDVAFIRRRMAHETAVHRWDAQTTTPSGPRPIDATLAADGIDEFLSFFVPYALGEGPPFEGSIHIHCTDIHGEWLLGRDGSYTVGHARGDAALRGPASDLLLALWRRRPLDEVEVVGHRAVADELISRLRIE